MTKLYTTKEVRAISKIPARTLQFYLDIEMILPENKRRRGVKRLFSVNSLFELLVINELKTTCDISLHVIRKTIKEMKKNDPELLKLETYNEYFKEDEIKFFFNHKVSLAINFPYIAHALKQAIA